MIPIRRKLKRVTIHREGRMILLLSLIFILGLDLLSIYMNRLSGITLSVLTAIVYLLLINFFRSPKRVFTGSRFNTVVSAADGKVVALEEVYEPEYLKRRCIQISVFMTIFDVHANWFPVNGEVIYYAYHRGRYLSAYLPKSSTENERSTIVIRTENNQEILVRQIAGAMARRIVTYAEPGMEANIEDHLGFIKFGSRVDIFLPLGTDIYTCIGEKTTGGMTVIAKLKG